MIRRLLIANRGEIACRIARTAHSMGIATVAVASDIERGAKHVRACDDAVILGGAAATDSYLAIEKVIAAAKACGADAIHPGYGFLAENAEFAAAVEEAGIVFVGPPAKVIDALGSKLRAGELATAAGIPTIPRFERGTVPDRFPVMVKASDGGGGKGMSIVRSSDDLEAAIDSAARIAKASFASDELIIEEYIEGARHIEVQILADGDGNVIHLGERECSIQRRHQKVIEEAPAPGLDAELREEMCSRAVELAKSVGYRSAGTVEMIASPDGRFFFLEVNTRLQVEHAVTEMTTGIDIVAEQLRIAGGEPLRLAQSDVLSCGVAIEARLYAEDPGAGDLPATGTIERLEEPGGDGVRIDSSLQVGDQIGIHYDPMLAKIIGHGASRDEACARLDRALAKLCVLGVATNRAALRRVIALEEFRSGKLDTQFWSRHRDAISTDVAPTWSAVAAAITGAVVRYRDRGVLPRITPAFRLGGPSEQREEFAVGADVIEVHYTPRSTSRFDVRCGDIDTTVDAQLDEGAIALWDSNGLRRRFEVAWSDDLFWVGDESGDWRLAVGSRFGDANASANAGDCAAPMPGRVAAVHVGVGDKVAAGQTLMILEAMKMEHPVRAPHDGEVTEIAARTGDQVDAEQVLAVVSTGE